MSELIKLPESIELISPIFVEGAILAANLTTKPLDPDSWAEELFAQQWPDLKNDVVERVNQQYLSLKANAYSVLPFTKGEDELADFAEGFLAIWPVVEPGWQEASLNDGTLRMLSALLTTFSLAVDEEQTHAQMREAGMEDLPQLADLKPQLDLMINEAALAADELLQGNKSQTVNPFKEVGRNDPCPCGSGKKFKKCCGA